MGEVDGVPRKPSNGMLSWHVASNNELGTNTSATSEVGASYEMRPVLVEAAEERVTWFDKAQVALGDANNAQAIFLDKGEMHKRHALVEAV